MKSKDLLAIVDFLYHGEANVFQENLDSFLAFAEEFQLKGFMGKSENKPKEFDEKPPPSFNTAKISKTSFSRQVPSTKILNPAEENTTLAIPCNLLPNQILRALGNGRTNRVTYSHPRAPVF